MKAIEAWLSEKPYGRHLKVWMSDGEFLVEACVHEESIITPRDKEGGEAFGGDMFEAVMLLDAAIASEAGRVLSACDDDNKREKDED